MGLYFVDFGNMPFLTILRVLREKKAHTTYSLHLFIFFYSNFFLLTAEFNNF